MSGDAVHARAMMGEILPVIKDHDPSCQCGWCRAFDALNEVTR